MFSGAPEGSDFTVSGTICLGALGPANACESEPGKKTGHPVSRAQVCSTGPATVAGGSNRYSVAGATTGSREGWNTQALEPEILRRPAGTQAGRQIKSLKKALEEEKKHIAAQDASRFIGANANFRLVLLSMCKNTLLTKCAELYDDQFQCFRIWGLNEPKNRELTARAHENIYNAIKNRNPVTAVKALQQLLDRVEDMLGEYSDSVAS